MIRTNETSLENKWVREIDVLNEHDFVNHNRALKYLKDFQFKINIGKVDENQCSYCNHVIESIHHLFVDCDRVKRFWQDLRQWLPSVANITFILEEKSILFSYQGKNQLVNYIITLAKHYIYITKFFANELDVNIFIVILKDKFQCEKYIAYLNNKLAKFLSKWRPLYNTFS